MLASPSLIVQQVQELAKDSFLQILHCLDYFYNHQQNPNYKYFCLNLFLHSFELHILHDLLQWYEYKLLDSELLKKELIHH